MLKRNLFAILIMSLTLVLTTGVSAQKKNRVEKQPTAKTKGQKPITSYEMKDAQVSSVKTNQPTNTSKSQKTKVKKPTIVSPTKPATIGGGENTTRPNRRKFDHIGNIKPTMTSKHKTTTQIGADMMEGTNIKTKPKGKGKNKP